MYFYILRKKLPSLYLGEDGGRSLEVAVLLRMKCIPGYSKQELLRCTPLVRSSPGMSRGCGILVAMWLSVLVGH